MAKGASGSVWRIDLASGEQACLARELAWPYGLLPDRRTAGSWSRRAGGTGCWRSRPRPAAAPEVVLTKLPGYPARLSPAAGGGAWLALFAPRNRLIEFVLLEDDYRAEMMRDVPRAYWIAPALSSGASFLEPLQCGAVRTMGIHKPWAPSRSYGLVVRLDAAAAAGREPAQPLERRPPRRSPASSRPPAGSTPPPRAAQRSSASMPTAGLA